MDDIRTKYDSVSFNIETPVGEANIIIAEESPGIIHKIFFIIGKAGSEVNANCYAIAELVSFALQHGAPLEEMIKLLSDITADRPVYGKDGIACRSIPEALYLILSRYNRFAEKFVDKPERRPPSFNHTR